MHGLRALSLVALVGFAAAHPHTTTTEFPGCEDESSTSSIASSTSAVSSTSASVSVTASVSATGSVGPSGSGASSAPLTTSTVTQTTTRTITSCAATITNCPGSPEHPFTTVETTVYTTICPVTETQSPSGNGTYHAPTSTKTYVTPASSSVPAGGAGGAPAGTSSAPAGGAPAGTSVPAGGAGGAPSVPAGGAGGAPAGSPSKTAGSAPVTTSAGGATAPTHVTVNGAAQKGAQIAAVLLGAVAVAFL